MSPKIAWVAAAAALMLNGGARATAEVATLTAGGSYATLGQEFSDLGGSGVLSLSSQWLKVLNDASVTLSALPQASLEVSTTGAEAGGGSYTHAAVSMPVLSLTTRIEQLRYPQLRQTVLVTHTQGGLMLSSMPGGQIAGELRISDLRIDQITHTISADIEGSNGVGFLNDHVLWTYGSEVGGTSVEWAAYSPPFGASVNEWTYNLSKLFLVDAGDVDSIFGKALNLNESQRRALRGLSDPNTQGFGSFYNAPSLVASPIPEPSAWALMTVGLIGLGVLWRRPMVR